MLDILIIIFLLLNAAAGLRRGFIKSFFGFFAFIIAIVAVIFLSGYMTEYLYTTQMPEAVHEYVTNAMGTQEVELSGNKAFPAIIAKSIEPVVNNAITSAKTEIAQQITAVIMGIIGNILTFGLVYITMLMLSGVLDVLFKLPVLSLVNKLLGLAFGLVNGVIIVFLILAVCGIFFNQQIQPLVENSIFAIYLYDNNPLLMLNTKVII